MWWSKGLLLQKVLLRLFPFTHLFMKNEDFNRAVRLTRIKVWVQNRFWKWINEADKIKPPFNDVQLKVMKYSKMLWRIEQELQGTIWLAGYNKKSKIKEG